MNLSFFKKTFLDFKWSIFWYGLTTMLYGVAMVSFFPSVRDMGGKFKEILESYPSVLTKAFGMTINSFDTIEGFLSVEYFSFVWVIIIGILIFSLGESIVAGEIDKGTSEFSFSLPLKRQKIFFEKFLASCFIFLIVTLLTLIGIIISANVIGETVNIKGFFAFFAVASAMGFFLLSFAAFFSSLFSSKGRVLGLCGGFFIVSYMIHILAGMSDKVSDFYFLSFFKYYGSPEAILINGSVDVRNILIFLTSGVVFLILGLLLIEKRDL